MELWSKDHNHFTGEEMKKILAVISVAAALMKPDEVYKIRSMKLTLDDVISLQKNIVFALKHNPFYSDFLLYTSPEDRVEPELTDSGLSLGPDWGLTR